MEFFASVIPAPVSATELQQYLTIPALPAWCGAIDTILQHDGDNGRLYCIWGEFDVLRTPIRGGVRFALLNCPNALAWTITTDLPPAPDEVVVHLTINRTEHDPDFVESMVLFVEQCRQGLADQLKM